MKKACVIFWGMMIPLVTGFISCSDGLPDYEVVKNEEWKGKYTFKVIVDSILSEDAAFGISERIKERKTSADGEITVYFYPSDTNRSAAQMVSFRKGNPIPYHLILSKSNKDIMKAKALKLDGVSEKDIIAEYLIPNAAIKNFVYKKGDEHYLVGLSSDGYLTPIDTLEVTREDSKTIDSFRVKSGVDEGMILRIDKRNKKVTFGEEGNAGLLIYDLLQ